MWGGAVPGPLGPPEGLCTGRGPGGHWPQGQQGKPVLFLRSSSQQHGSHPQQTTLLDLMDALPSAGPAAPKAEPWGPSASASQTNPWGAPAAPGSTSDPWPSFGKDLPRTSPLPACWTGERLQGARLPLTWQRWEWVWVVGVGVQTSAAPRSAPLRTAVQGSASSCCEWFSALGDFFSAAHTPRRGLVPSLGHASTLSASELHPRLRNCNTQHETSKSPCCN